MKPSEENPVLEKLLDRGLKQFGQASPRAGLEARVMARLREEQPATRLWRWWPAVAAVGLLALVAGLVLGRKPDHALEAKDRPPAVEITGPGELLPKPSRESTPNLRAKRTQRMGVRSVARVVPITTEPRREQFPSSRPLSSQEELLLTYVTQAPVEEVTATASRGTTIVDLQISQLSVAPLAEEHAASKSGTTN